MGRLIRILLVLVLIMPSVVSAAEISMRLDSIGLNVYQHLHLPTAGNTNIPDSIRNTAINEAIAQVCQDFPAVEKLDTVVLAVDTKGVTLNGDFLRVNWALKFATVEEDAVVVPLQYAPVSQLFDLFGGLDKADRNYNNEASPRYFFTFNDKIFFYPQPWSADTVVIAYYAMDSLLQLSSSVSQVLPQYRDAVVSLACYKLAVLQERFEVAGAFLSRYNELLKYAFKPEKKQE